jgi:hypothetical protein
MRTIDIYDIAGDKWYRQPTESAPKALTRGCAVAIPAKDYSSFNIYYYGGYKGTDAASEFNDDVYVLSLPSFMWMKVSSGNPDHARAGHKCVTPYPDQMMVIGGYTPATGTSLSCVKGGIIQLFNLTSGKWMDSYNPGVYHEYGVPEMIHVMIGGDYKGGATVTTPLPTGWATVALGSVFATPYPTSKLTTYYPYGSASPTGRPNVDGDGGNNGGGGGSSLPNWAAPLIGTLLGLVVLTIVVVAIFVCRKRRILRYQGTSEAGTEDKGMRIMSWIKGQPSDGHKAPTVTTDETPMSLNDVMEIRSPPPPRSAFIHHEMADTQVAELMG